MASLISSNKQMFSVREVPWHGLGTIIQEAPNAEEAIKLANLDWEVKPMRGAFIYNSNTYEIPNQISNVRMDTMESLGTVTDNYKLIQNKEAFSFLDALLDEGAKFETAGWLGRGETVWMLARMPEGDILGDKIANYMVISNSHDGKGSIHVNATNVRVVCKNTLNIALATAFRSWSATHMGNIESKKKEASQCLGLNNKYTKALAEEAERMVDIKISDAEFLKFCENLFPVDEDASDRVKDNVLTLRTDLQTRYFNASDLSQFRKTQWGVINAVSDHAYHAEPLRKSITFQENKFAQVIDGNKVLDRAYALLKNGNKKVKVA
jgi:phage/plasmid-like protein (TIGR03299 family)